MDCKNSISHAAADRDSHVASAQKALSTTVEPARHNRAELKGTEEQIQELWDAVNEVRQTNERNRERLRMLRGSLATRRRTLAIATSTHHHLLSGSHSTSGSPGSTSASPPNTHTPGLPGAPHSPPAWLLVVLRILFILYPGGRRRIHTHCNPPPAPRRSSVQLALRVPVVAVYPVACLCVPAECAGLARQVDEARFQLVMLSDKLARARSGLVQELVEVFSVVEVGGRPPIGGKAGTKGEWTIGGLVLPVPGDMRRYPPDHINAVITHTIHFITLLSFYLGIKLPFEIIWSRSGAPPASNPSFSSSSLSHGKGNGLLGVGVPWIGAIKGNENGGWARWSAKQPLHVSAASPPSPSSTNAPSSSPSHPSSHSRSVSTPFAPSSLPPARTRSEISASLADSQIDEQVTTTGSLHGSSFTTALAMLVYDVCYLAYSQAVEVPLAQAGELLGNLWAVCCSPELGSARCRKSHSTHPLLAPPTPPSFPLDFAQLLQATAAKPTRSRARGASGKERAHTEQIVEEDEEGWDLVDPSVE
ncbi:predicted protein [Postia placenta Mad-698-R]|nr:predicted protein [Postia placenta Mad-698-R]